MALFTAVLLSHSQVSGIALDVRDNHTHHKYQLVEKVKRGRKSEKDVDFAALGGLLGGITGVVGGIVGGKAGQDISNSGNLIAGVSSAAGNGGSTGDIVAAAAHGVGAFGPDIGFMGNADAVGKALGGAIDNVDSGNVAGAFTALDGAAALAPGAGGEFLRLGTGTASSIIQAADKKDTNAIVGSLGNASGSFIGGVAGAHIHNLTPTF